MAPRKKAADNIDARLTAYKSNKIIYIGNAQRVDRWDELTANQLKIAMFSAAQVRPDDSPLNEYTMTFKEFSELAGLDKDSSGGANYKRVFNEARKLSKLGVDFVAADGTLIGFNWLVSVRVSPKSGTVTYSIDKNLLPFYTSRAGTFALIELLDYMPLRGKYALLLYEFLSKWRVAGQVYQTIPDLRAQLQVPEGKYPRIVDFLAWVIKPAIDEINDKATVSFKVKTTEKRGGRGKLEGILFTIKPIITVADEQAELLDLMTEVELPQPVALAILNDPKRPINRDYIVKNIKAGDEYLRILAARKETPKSRRSIYMAALQNDWAGILQGEPLFDAAEVTPPGLCPFCAGVGIITGPDGRTTNCSCLALPPDPNVDEDRKPITGPIADAFKDVFATIGAGGTGSLPAAEPEEAVRESPAPLKEFLAKNRPLKNNEQKGPQ